MDAIKEGNDNRPLKGSRTLDLLPIAIAAIIGLLIILIIFVIKKRSASRKDFLLTGLSESGKTSMFMQLIYNKSGSTFTSITENIGDYQSGRVAGRLIDIPGHYRVRNKYFDKYKRLAKGIIFVVDSVTVQKEIRDVADALYTMLADSATMPCSVIVLCNKQDLTMAKSAQVIKNLLEKEMHLVRDTRSRKLQSTSEEDESKTIFLGLEGKDFEFSQLPQNIQFQECSCKNNELNAVTDWLDRML